MNILRQILIFCKDIYAYIRFPYSYIAYRGVFQNFEQAYKAMPQTQGRNKGYKETSLELLQNWCNSFSAPIKLVDTEYPIFFHLDRILTENPNANVCDFGGANGRHYFAYTSHNKLKPKWQVVELDSNVKLGRQMLEQLKIDNLSFSTHINPAQILLSSSAFQYVENIWSLLEHSILTGGGAEHILLTRIPIQTKVKTFVTLQNALNEYYIPLYIFNRDEFLGFFYQHGYKLIDEWKDPFDSSIIPFHRNISPHQYSGFYLQKEQP